MIMLVALALAAALVSPTYTILNTDIESVCEMSVTYEGGHGYHFAYRDGGYVRFHGIRPQRGEYRIIAHRDGNTVYSEMMEVAADDRFTNSTAIGGFMDDDALEILMTANDITLQQNSGKGWIEIKNYSLTGSYRAFSNFYQRCR